MIGFEGANRPGLLREYRRRISVESVLAHYGAENSFQIGDEIQHSCLLDRVEPHHQNGDQNPSARANLEKKTYICYSFGGGDIFWLIAKLEGKENPIDILPMLGEFLEDSVVEPNAFIAELEKSFAQNKIKFELPTYHEKVLERWALVHPYLYKGRGVSPEACARLQVGFDEHENRIIFPHWVDVGGGNVKLVGWQKRSQTDPRWPITLPDIHGQTPKYKNSTGLPKNDTVYNLERVKSLGAERVIVVESPMSVLKAETFSTGPDDILSAVVSTFGAKVGDGQVDLLKQFSEVIVFMDDDYPGRAASQKLVTELYRHTAVSHIEPEVGMDMADYDSGAAIREMIDRREPAVMTMARWRI